jgi:hypothetical protein
MIHLRQQGQAGKDKEREAQYALVHKKATPKNKLQIFGVYPLKVTGK